jgi:hypothetical protein
VGKALGMKRNLHAAVMVLSLLSPLAATAADYSVTAFAGWRTSTGIDEAVTGEQADIDDSAAFSIALDRSLDAGRTLQLFFSQQNTRLAIGGPTPTAFDLRVQHLHLGGTFYIEGPVGAGPYAVGGLGVTSLSPGLDGLDDEVRPSLNVGFGYAWPVGTNVAVRIEARGYFTLLNSSGGLFCSGGCVVVLKGDGLTQGELMLGLSGRF